MKKRRRIVTIGGGTGHFTLLTAIRKLREEFPGFDVTAIVTATDSGGSSGQLRIERGILPPGDIIQCLLALSEFPHRDALTEFLRRRFSGRKGRAKLGGHSVGNLLLTMLAEHTGSFADGLSAMHRILDVRGEVLPVTSEDVQLCAALEDGTELVGEATIDTRGKKAIEAGIATLSPMQRVWLNKEVRADALVLKRIREASAIVIGPGDLWTSILPTLLPKGVSEAICSSRAMKVFATNIMTKFGETDHYTVLRFLTVLTEYLGGEAIDVVLYNTARLQRPIVDRYAEERAALVAVGEIMKLNRPFFHGANLVSRSTLARHSAAKLAIALEEIVHAQLE